MGDILRYRLPGKEITELIGRFYRMDDRENGYTGFIISGFDSRNIYGFREDFSDPEYHFKDKMPFVIKEQEYNEIASLFMAAFKRKGIDKAVFSRVKAIEFDEKYCDQLFHDLTTAYPSAFVYCISSTLFGTWIGATPEKLLSIDSLKASTVSLAGTKKSGDNSPWGEKESQEQAYVTDFILDRLKKAGMSDIEMSQRYEAIAGPVKHLKNDIGFTLNGADPLKIAMELHPTPAVSGFPQKEAMELILEVEPHDRELYTGFIGVIGDGATDLFVNLRCCSIQEDSAYLYLGGGFTLSSSIEEEWQETENKSKTLLNILQKF
ncbi:MAG: chorismate-binding protein [Flavobacteriia bacterium]